MPGNVEKDAKYLERIRSATALDLSHPRHHGVKMQAHHVISAKSVALMGRAFGRKLAQLGYDINGLANLVFIPSTLQGACHLCVQPHRGDHSTAASDDERDSDDEPMTYHELVKLRLNALKRTVEGKCPKEHPTLPEEVWVAMNNISSKVLTLIQRMPAAAPLTRVAGSFCSEKKVGCSGADSVSAHHGGVCPVGRNHRNNEGASQSKEGISYPRSLVAYHLRTGR